MARRCCDQTWASKVGFIGFGTIRGRYCIFTIRKRRRRTVWQAQWVTTIRVRKTVSHPEINVCIHTDNNDTYDRVYITVCYIMSCKSSFQGVFDRNLHRDSERFSTTITCVTIKMSHINMRIYVYVLDQETYESLNASRAHVHVS